MFPWDRHEISSVKDGERLVWVHATSFLGSSLFLPRDVLFPWDRGWEASAVFKVIPQYCTAHPLLRIISHAINARALENGGFFFTARPRHRSKSSFLRKRVW